MKRVEVGQVLDHQLIVVQVADVEVSALREHFEALFPVATAEPDHSDVFELLALCQLEQ